MSSPDDTTPSWDAPGVAEELDTYWRRDATGYEAAHRNLIARLIQSYTAPGVESLLEVGCGSGLIHEALVPEVVPCEGYVGVDNSREMVRLARRRFPAGRFEVGDAYELQFEDGSFDTTAAFEVLGHLPDLTRPIAELVRVAARFVFFTVWISASGRSQTGTQTVGDAEFLYRELDPEEVADAIASAVGEGAGLIETRVLSSHKWAYVIHKKGSGPRVTRPQRILPFRGLIRELTHRQLAGQETLAETQQELRLERRRVVELTDQQLAGQETLAETQRELRLERRRVIELEERLRHTREKSRRRHAKLVELVDTVQTNKRDYARLFGKANALADELHAIRSRRFVRVWSRLVDRFDQRSTISPAFRQLLDDSLLFGPSLEKFQLRPSPPLEAGCAYSLAIDRPGLSAILVAPIVDLPQEDGKLVLEIRTPQDELIRRSSIPLRKIKDHEPTLFSFEPVPDSGERSLVCAIFTEGATLPIRCWEWVGYGRFFFGRKQRRPFFGFAFGGEKLDSKRLRPARRRRPETKT